MDRDALPPGRIEATLGRIETWFAESDCPGMSVAVTDEHDVIAQRGFGRRTVDPDRPATESTLYAVGSVSKPITALAILLLDERGRIDVHEPISDYVPFFEDCPGEPISIHQLLSHTSGMPRDDLAFRGSDLDGWDEFRDFLDGTAGRRRVDHEGCIYYNSGYAVLARLVEVVTGTDFPSFVDREIFVPLGMRRSTFDSAVLERADDAMTAYKPDAETFREVDVDDNPVFESKLLNGPGGVLTSVPDLARFLQAHIGAGLPGEPVTLERMHRPVGTIKRLVDGSEFTYGYGWGSKPFGSDTLVGHAGNTGVSAGFVGFLEARGIAIAIGCNGPADPERVGRHALAVLTGRDQASVDPGRSIERTLRRLAGRYESYAGTHRATVSHSDAALEIEFGGGVEPFALRAIPTDLDGGQFEFTDVERVESTTDVEFFVNDDGIELLFEGALFRRVETDAGDDRAIE